MELSCRRAFVALSFLLFSASAALSAPAAPSKALPTIATPSDDPGAASLARRMKDQSAAAEAVHAFVGFRLHHHEAESGIDFTHHIVDDGGRAYKQVHYDHGNGLAAADVDGDGRVDLYFLTQLGRNELWRNLGGGRFEDITDKAGVGLADRVSVTASFADADNDGDPDLYVTTVNMGNVLFENLGGGRFRDATESAGLTHVGHSSGAVWFDYNRDGLLDLFVTDIGVYTHPEKGPGGYYIGYTDAFHGHLYPERFERSLLYENRGGLKFTEVSAQRGLDDVSWSGDADFSDVDGDGYPDLYVLNMQGDDHFYRNVEGKKFVDETAKRFPKTPWGAMGIAFLDYDDDGDFDLYLTDMHSDMSRAVDYEHEGQKSNIAWDEDYLQDSSNNILGNAFYRNKGDGSYEEVSDQLGVETYWPWGVSVGDLNADGFEDMVVTNSMNFPYRYEPSSILINDGGKRFVDLAFPLGLEPRPGGRTQTPWFEVDCSGADAKAPYCRGRSGRQMLTATLGCRSSILVDLDGDGDQDLVTNDFNSPAQVLLSDLSDKRPVHYLKLALRGTKSNRQGLGAVVRVHVGSRVLTRQVDGKSGYLSQSDVPLYVGLGAADHADRIEITWPSGIEQAIPGPIAVGGHEIVEQAPAAAESEAEEAPTGR